MLLLQNLLSDSSWVEVVLAQFALRSLDIQDTYENCLALANGIVINYRALGSGGQACKHIKDLICGLVESVLCPWRMLNPPMHCLEKSIVKLWIWLNPGASMDTVITDRCNKIFKFCNLLPSCKLVLSPITGP